MDNELYISPVKLVKKFDITSGTLRRWAEEGKIRCLRPNASERGGKRIYNVEDVKRIFGVQEVEPKKQRICYARVSSAHQKGDLERQVQLLQQEFPDHRIIQDIGSGLNWNRKGFKTLLEQIHQGDVEQVVVAYKDRLCRFGFELVEWIFKKSNVKLVVLNADINTEDMRRELSEDLLAITTVFVARNNGIRSAQYRKKRREQEQQERQGTSGENDKNQDLSD